jgi:CheY-like chemotaxis protein
MPRNKEGTVSDETPKGEPHPTILVIDDDRLVLGVCTAVLEGHGYRAVMATHGQAGLAMALRERPVLILLDIRMPGMDGYEVCRQVRADPRLRHTPIVLMTAMTEPDLERKGADAGATVSLRKPFDAEQIINTVDQVLGRTPRSEPS